jgi:hypothetical protein
LLLLVLEPARLLAGSQLGGLVREVLRLRGLPLGLHGRDRLGRVLHGTFVGLLLLTRVLGGLLPRRLLRGLGCRLGSGAAGLLGEAGFLLGCGAGCLLGGFALGLLDCSAGCVLGLLGGGAFGLLRLFGSRASLLLGREDEVVLCPGGLLARGALGLEPRTVRCPRLGLGLGAHG